MKKFDFESLWTALNSKPKKVDPFGMDRELVKKVKPLFDFLYHDYWRIQVVGIKKVKPHGAGLIVANHSGVLPYDGAMLKLSLLNHHPAKRDLRFLVGKFAYRFSFLGDLMRRLGGIEANYENAQALLSAGHLVAVFPEGVRGLGKSYKDRYQLQSFGHGGFVKLSLQTKTPIYPVAIIGAEEIHPLLHQSTVLAKLLGLPYFPIPLTFVPLPSRWKIFYGKPFHFYKSHSPQEAKDQRLVNHLADQVRSRVQQMLLEGLKKRKSVWV